VTGVALLLAAALAVACVLYVARPFIAEPEPESDVLAEPDERERRLLELLEERDRSLAALKELEFDHRTGKIGDDDYRQVVGPLRRAAADALRALDAGASSGRAPSGRAPSGEARYGPGMTHTTMIEAPAPAPAPVPEPAPPPDEGTPPTPAPVPEPYPPPDEATPPNPPQIPPP